MKAVIQLDTEVAVLFTRQEKGGRGRGGHQLGEEAIVVSLGTTPGGLHGSMGHAHTLPKLITNGKRVPFTVTKKYIWKHCADIDTVPSSPPDILPHPRQCHRRRHIQSQAALLP
jgi:hypothetical protein